MGKSEKHSNVRPWYLPKALVKFLEADLGKYLSKQDYGDLLKRVLPILNKGLTREQAKITLNFLEESMQGEFKGMDILVAV